MTTFGEDVPVPPLDSPLLYGQFRVRCKKCGREMTTASKTSIKCRFCGYPINTQKRRVQA